MGKISKWIQGSKEAKMQWTFGRLWRTINRNANIFHLYAVMIHSVVYVTREESIITKYTFLKIFEKMSQKHKYSILCTIFKCFINSTNLKTFYKHL